LGSSDAGEEALSPLKSSTRSECANDICHSVSGDFGIQTVQPGDDSDSEIRFSDEKKPVDVSEGFPKPFL
jgi:hypothetical protein